MEEKPTRSEKKINKIFIKYTFRQNIDKFLCKYDIIKLTTSLKIVETLCDTPRFIIIIDI